VNLLHFLRRPIAATFVVAGLALLLGISACSPSPPIGQGAAGQFMGHLEAQPGAPATGEMKTFALVAVNSYQKLMGSVSFLGSLVGMPDANRVAEAQVLQLIQDKGLGAIDKARPWGALLQTDGAGFSMYGLIPTAKPDDLFAVVAANGIAVNQTPTGLRQLNLPNGMTVFAKSDAGWTLISESEQSLARTPADFQADLTRLANEYDIGVRLLVSNLPEMARQMVLGGIRSGAEMALRPQPGETPEQTDARRQAAEARIKDFEQIFQEIDKLTVGMKIDTQGQKAYFDTAIEAVPGTDLGKQMQAQGESRTNFAGFRQSNAAAMLTFASQTDPASSQELRQSRDEIRKSLHAAIDNDENVPAPMREAFKSAGDDFLDAMLATAEAGRVDAAASLLANPDSLTFVAAALVKDTDKLVSGLKKLEAAVKQQSPDAPGIQWNASQQGGVAFHTLNVPLPPDADESLRRMLGGELSVALGIGQETAYLAIGRDHMAAVQKAIEASRAEPNKSVPQFELALSLKPLLALAAAQATDPDAKTTLQMVGTTLQNDPRGRDHIRILGEAIPNGSRMRFEAEQGAMQAVAQAAFLLQMRAMGGR
jgi:hypothetical protein